MPTHSPSQIGLLARFNAGFERILLALWPEENKSWGLAFASESAAIESPRKQFRWLLGGIPVLLRESCKALLGSLGRPIGVGPREATGSGPRHGRTPRTPRAVVALFFLVFAVLLALPQTRTVFRSVSQAYTAEGWDTSRWPEVRRLQILAEKNLKQQNRDSQLLAFASLLYSDEQRRLAFANAAIEADPTLTWIDYQNAQYALSADRINRMLAADAGNGALHLLRAESIVRSYRQKDAQADPNAIDIANWGTDAWHDPNWLAAMNAAFQSPHYDAYDTKLFELSRGVMLRYAVNDPRILASVLGRRPLDQYQAIRRYTNILLARAAAAKQAGDRQSALSDCTILLDFAGHLRTANFFKLEVWTANDIESQTYPLLQSVHESSGQKREALEIAARMQENRAERAAFSSNFPRFSQPALARWSKAEWAGLLMQTSVLTIWVLFPVSLASTILLWLLRDRLRITGGVFHSLLCLFSDLCPGFLVLACAILFIAYAPYYQAYHQILNSSFSSASYQDFGKAAYAPFALPGGVDTMVGWLPPVRFLGWCSITAALILLVAALVYRQLPKRGGLTP